jgi:hypothetical protein
MIMARSISIVVATALCGLLSQPAAAAPIKPNTGAAMCGALTPADFTAAGIQGTAKPQANVLHPTAAYCVFSGTSGEMGGVELDVFYWAGMNEATVKQHEQTLLAQTGGNVGAGSYKKIQMNGVDSAYFGTALARNGPPFASILVQRAALIIIISAPPGPRASDQLTRLATVALQRF